MAEKEEQTVSADNQSQDLLDEVSSEPAQAFEAKNKFRGRIHHEAEDLEFDADEVEETYGVAWTQNVRLMVAIVIVIISAIFIWWFVW